MKGSLSAASQEGSLNYDFFFLQEEEEGKSLS